MGAHLHGLIEKLQNANVRPTRQRVIIAQRLWQSGAHRHVTAEQIYQECEQANSPVSLATVYNTLHQFERAGLLREVATGNASNCFDTNIKPHHHFYYEHTGELEDIDASLIEVSGVPQLRAGSGAIKSIELLVRVQA